MASRRWGSFWTLALVIGLAASSWAQVVEEGGAATGTYREGQHIVRPGDTLEDITRRYLGSARRWRENWKLNPQIEDPDLLLPGLRLLVLLAPRESIPTARLRSLAGRVEDRPNPIPWNPAQERDLLLERDGLRTFKKSSTAMEFPDGTSLVLTEDSVVFLRKGGGRSIPEKTENKSVEIVEGQADLAARLDPQTAAEVEILMGGARAISRVDPSGVAQTRARRPQDGGAQVMVYEGASAVEAAGEQVAVERGMGTSVSKDGPPAPPEKLLPAPAPISPEKSSRWNSNRPIFRWRPVDGAASYVVEVCLDPDCGRLLDRALQLTAARWQPQGLQVAELFWRVTAVSRSGLDGYPSAATPFSVLDDRADTTPPRAKLRLTAANQTRSGATLYVDSSVTFEVLVEDGESGLDRWMPRVNEREISRQEWARPWTEGTYRVAVEAVDQAGNSSLSEPLVFVVDTRPPTIRTHVRGCSAGLGRAAVPPKVRSRWLAQGREWLEWSVDCDQWWPLFWGPEGSSMARSPGLRALVPPAGSSFSSFRIRSEQPQFFLRSAVSGKPKLGTETQLGDDEVLQVAARDAGAGVEVLQVRVLAGPAGSGVVEAVATDALGHQATVSWRAGEW